MEKETDVRKGHAEITVKDKQTGAIKLKVRVPKHSRVKWSSDGVRTMPKTGANIILFPSPMGFPENQTEFSVHHFSCRDKEAGERKSLLCNKITCLES